MERGDGQLDDPSALPEAFWDAPRENNPPDRVGGLGRILRRSESAGTGARAAAPDALRRSDVDALLQRQADRLRSELLAELEGRLGPVDEELRQQHARLAAVSQGQAGVQAQALTPAEVATLRSALDELHVRTGDLATRLDDVVTSADLSTVLVEAAENADARVAVAEARLLGRIEALAEEMYQQVRAIHAGRDAERAESAAAGSDLSDRIAALDARLSGVAGDVGGVRGDLAADRAEAEARMTELESTVGERLDAAFAAVDDAEARLDRTAAELAASVDAARSDVAATRPELEARLTELKAELRAEVDEQLEAPRPERGGGKVETRRRGGRKEREDVGQLRDAIDAWQAASVTKDDLVALRADLQETISERLASAQGEMRRIVASLHVLANEAETYLSERADGMAEWVLGEAVKATERTLAELRDQVEQVSAGAAKPRKRPPPKPRNLT